jgi:hypothetical protein
VNTRLLLFAAVVVSALPATARAQAHEHRPGMSHAEEPVQPGQSAFAAIAEIVGILMADPSTDWSKVNIEALRQHLMDMDDVTLRSSVVQEMIDGGARFTVTGAGRTIEAIQRMTTAHGQMVASDSVHRVTVEQVPGGARIAVVARNAADATTVMRIRGLGFHGLLTTGAHHGPHHLAIARGTPPAGHAHDE